MPLSHMTLSRTRAGVTVQGESNTAQMRELIRIGIFAVQFTCWIHVVKYCIMLVSARVPTAAPARWPAWPFGAKISHMPGASFAYRIMR